MDEDKVARMEAALLRADELVYLVLASSARGLDAEEIDDAVAAYQEARNLEDE